MFYECTDGFVKLIKIVKVSALTNARMVVDQSDLLVLCHCLWNNPSNKETITQLVSSYLQNSVGAKQNDNAKQIYRVKKSLNMRIINHLALEWFDVMPGSQEANIIASEYNATNPYVIVHDGKTCELLGVSSLEAGVHCRFVCVQGSLPKKIKLEGMKSEYDFDEVFEPCDTNIKKVDKDIEYKYQELIIHNIWL